MPDQIIVKSQAATTCPSVEAVILAVAARRSPVVLDSMAIGPRRGRFTIVACDPLYEWSCRPGDPDPFEQLRRHLSQSADRIRLPADAPAAARVFCGGWIGYFGYEAGRYIERLPARTRADVGMALARWAFYDTAAIYDAATGRWTLVGVDLAGSGLELPNAALARPQPTLARPGHTLARPWPSPAHPQPTPARTKTRPETDRCPVGERLAAWDRFVSNCIRNNVMVYGPPPLNDPVHNLSREAYTEMVERALAYIGAGDIYQVNLARRESYELREPAVATYLRLRQTNPAAYAAFLSWQEPTGEAAVLSSSPELFLRLRGRRVLTRPIKGTRPRSTDAGVDQAYRRALCQSPKDRAELAMIVDLERNDLGRVCEYGSVRVQCPVGSPADPYVLESHPTVHHLVSDVTGRLAEGYDAVDLVRACFPGGSITGAPKVRAMEIIDELEPTERGVYTGSIGYFGLNGDVTLNIAIRTMVVAGGRLHMYVGGGIVADSRPDDEYQETEAKALGMRRALGQTVGVHVGA